MNDAIQALRLGACDYLVKPLPDSSVLIHAGEKSLGHQNLTQGALWGPHLADFLKQLP